MIRFLSSRLRFLPHIPLESSEKRTVFVRMNIHAILRVLNSAIRAAFIAIGILLIAGFFNLRSIAPEFRIILGAVFILYGVFRIVTLDDGNLPLTALRPNPICMTSAPTKW